MISLGTGGGLTFTVPECNPLQGPLLMQAAEEIMAGRTLPKRIVPPEAIFTQESAAIALNNRKF